MDGEQVLAVTVGGSGGALMQSIAEAIRELAAKNPPDALSSAIKEWLEEQDRKSTQPQPTLPKEVQS